MTKPNRPPARRGVKLLRVLRAERQLSQQALGDQAGLTQTRYWQIEHGQGAAVRAVERAAIARVLQVSPKAIAWPIRDDLTPLQISRAEARALRQARRAAALDQAV